MQRLLKAGRGESWARTAVDHGFYDEAHMAADVRQLAGATPPRCWRRDVRFFLGGAGRAAYRRLREPDRKEVTAMDVQFITSFAVVTPDPEASRGLYVEALGLPLEGEDGGYLHSEEVGGSRHFGVWPLSAAAQSCFGAPEWPADRPTPQASVEFEVESLEALDVAAEELVGRGFELLHGTREEPWGQAVARLQTLEGLIVGISFAPQLHD